MTKRKETGRALFLSIVSLVLSMSMLVGTTMAWFTDTVTSGVNQIIAGNLDVDVYTDGNPDNSIQEQTTLFNDVTLWEPGAVAYENLTVANLGTLALKYQLSINFTNENTVNGYGLSQILKVAVIENGVNLDKKLSREELVASIAENAWIPMADFSETGKLLPEGSTLNVPDAVEGEKTYGIVIWWKPTTDDNNWNVNNGKSTSDGAKYLHIDLGVELFATQLEAESDSFDNTYDKNAPWAGEANEGWYNEAASEFVITTAEELAGLAALVNAGNDMAGKTIKLGADIDLADRAWTPIGVRGANFNGSFNGNGYTISNLNVTGTEGVGLIGIAGNAAHIEQVKIVGATVSGTHWVGAVLGYGYLAKDCLKDCHVENAVITCTPVLKDNGKYDDGDKAGAIAGMAINGAITGNYAKNVQVIAYRDLGGIVGCAQAENRDIEVSGNKIEDVVLTYVGVIGAYDGKENMNMGDIVGRESEGTYTVEIGTNEGTVETDDAGAIVISTDDELYAFAADVNAGNTYAGKTVILGADIDLRNMEWTPIGTGDGFKGIFDGNGHTISNLKITGNNSTVGLFANTYNGEIKNLTVENAQVSGRLNVGVVAGNPYTSKYTNIIVKGHVEVNGSSYVGGVGGKNAYANWTDITVDVDETSYVKAVSTEYDPDSKYADENGYVAYRTYVGGVVGFNGEGSHTFKNITSNIDVIGDVCDIGGAFGIGHYNNKFENVTVTGNVTCTGNADEIGGILGVWHNENGTSVSLTNCKFTGKITAADGDVSGCEFVGAAYTSTGTGKLIIDGKTLVKDAEAMADVLSNGGDVILAEDVETEAATTAPYGNKYAFKLDGGTLDGNGYELHMECYGDDYGIMTSGGTIKNLTIQEGCRAIMIMYPQQDIIVDNVNIGGDGVLYPINTGEAGAEGVDLIVTNSTLAGWTSFSNIESASFTNVTFKQGTYYNNIYGRVLKPYVNTTLTNCSFVAHMNLDLSGLAQGQKITFVNCTVNGQVVNADVFTVPTTDDQYDTELFTVDLPSWANSVTDCVVFG